MKIAISCENNKKDSKMDSRFGRCRYFYIHNLDSSEEYHIENEGNSSGGGAGIAAAQQIINEEVDAVISGNIGPNAYDLLKSSDIKMYRGNGDSCEKTIESLKNSELDEIKKAGPSHLGMRK